MKCNVENKIKFVKGLSESIVPFKSGVVSIDYRVFEYPEKGWTQEYLVINYDGGSKTQRQLEIVMVIVSVRFFKKSLDI